MKKIIAFIFILTLSLGFFSNKAYAYQYAGNCPNLTQIPISVAPQSGNQTTQFKVTLFWSQLSKDDFNKYKDIDISIVTDIQGKPNTSATDPSYTRTTQVDRTQTLSNFFIIAGTYDVPIHLNTDVYGACKNYEANPVSITLQSTAVNNPSPGATSGLKPGDICSPDLQNNSQYACPTNAPCTKISLEYKCSTPTKTSISTTPPPLPPCEKGFDKTGTLTTDRSQIKSCSTIDTALGFIDTDPAGFVKSIFGIVLSLAGGVALILIMISGYRLMASQGNPEKVKEAQESLTSAIVGLLFIIFSITILKIIGVDILHIPGFN